MTEERINVPVKLQTDEQGAGIEPGDYPIGDLNDVVCLPRVLIRKAITLMGLQVEADEKIAAVLERRALKHLRSIKRVLGRFGI